MIKLFLAKSPAYSRVELDGLDITSKVRRISSRASVDDRLSEVTLTLFDDMEVDGDAGVLQIATDSAASRELNRIDGLLMRRDALDSEPDRYAKIAKLLAAVKQATEAVIDRDNEIARLTRAHK